MQKLLLGAILVPGALSALPMQPWLGNVYEFFADTSYTFSFYHHVANGRPTTKHTSYDSQFFFGLGFTPIQYWDVYGELELARTNQQAFDWRSAALQARYQWLDDILGDPVSLTTGASVRGVNHKSLKDVSCPYAAEFDAELNSAIGKEWSRGPYWVFRTYLFGAVGIAQRGAPWARFYYTLRMNRESRHQFELFTRGDFGFGGKNHVNIHHFHGYANIHHQSIDVGASYALLFRLWGKLTFEYAHRFYAHAFPERVNFFMVWYHLPFSLF